MKIETLYSNPWISIRYLEEGDIKYTYFHDDYSKSYAIAVLPYRHKDYFSPTGELEYLLRKEVVPPWNLGRLDIGESISTRKIVSLTGSLESENIEIKNVFNKAIEEIREESGYIVEEKDLIYLGHSYISKKSDGIVFLFAVDLTGFDDGEELGDGTHLESLSESFWSSDIDSSEDSLTYVLYYKLNKYFNSKFNR